MILRGIGVLTVAYYSVRILLMVRQALQLWSMSYFKWDTRLKKRFGDWAVVTGSTDGIGKQYALQLAQRGLNVVLISRNPHKLRAVAEEIGQSVASVVVAVVTGSTDGVGKQYALQLAQRGLNVVLISRNPHKLRAVAEEIVTKHNVKTKTIVADFSTGTEVYAHIEAELQDLPVGILVNNVGVLDDHPIRFCDAPLERLWEMVNVNVVSAVSMCRLLLPGMLRRNRGVVVNVSSAAGWQATPLMGVYSSTKAFINNFTMLLRAEYAHTDVQFNFVYPMFISSNLTAFSESIHRGDLFTPDAAAYAMQAVNAIGTIPATTGYWSQALKMDFLLLLPTWARTKIGHFILRGLQHEYNMRNNVKNKQKPS
ncbi:inactive hydroxysteroid dehydrogenase-like protein 1 isoform X2 [Aricia agestis]|uniref:inactive hydroxysteroid dehydrogenase-like protein 1 isoform X2 n=1 Tax=Aricia agestis TaxID=91739 RepID=UPI001C20943D|nr:inactive hydroxysteroid dehydrogenase-like protein 1 isoform X2 [Aricia agestis]